MRSRRHTSESEEHGIDLAPMLDFVMNLLIFFIITTSFVKEAGVTVNRENAATAVTHDTGNIMIAVTATGDVWMDRRRVDLREVRPLIERMHLERPDDSVVIIADKGSKSGIVGQVMDEVKAGGIKQVALGATGTGQE